MYFGNYGHVASDDDLTIFRCNKCGWVSEELKREAVNNLGVPWACQSCGKYGVTFVKFHPRERARARSVFLGEET